VAAHGDRVEPGRLEADAGVSAMTSDTRTETFATPGHVALSLRIPSGSVMVRTGQTQETRVDVEALNDLAEELLPRTHIEARERGDRHEVTIEVPEQRGGFFRFSSPSFEVRIECPDNADLSLRTGSADLEARGDYGDVQVTSASGDIELDHVHGELRAKSASGDVAADAVDGQATVETASGDVQLGRVGGPVTAGVVSGDLTIREAGSSVSARSVSGDQRLDSVTEGEVNVQAVSGDVVVGIKRGSRLWVDANSVSGETSSELELSGDESDEEGPLVEVRARTVSGDFRLVRA
jgi:Putative adhesin